VVESGLTEDDGWVAVDKATLATKWPDVYAVGDVASTPVPRAGVIAEGEASTVADVLIHTLRGGPAPAPFAGEITCYVEMGGETIGRVNVNFLSGPAPVAVYSPPSLEGTEEKAVRRHAPRPLVRHRARLTRHHSGSALTASCSACVICRQG
jgi:sulfide:quinone oxidoreductase